MRALVHRAGDRFTLAAMLAVVASLSAFVVCLELIGPPPRWRIDALWVLGRARAVRLMIAALLIAAAATVLMLLLFRSQRGGEERRLIIVLLWLGAAVACAMLYWDRLPIIYNVVMRHAW